MVDLVQMSASEKEKAQMSAIVRAAKVCKNSSWLVVLPWLISMNVDFSVAGAGALSLFFRRCLYAFSFSPLFRWLRTFCTCYLHTKKRTKDKSE